ncbi:MAG: FlgD immunoglobulin-like domain containing protein [bacterium]
MNIMKRLMKKLLLIIAALTFIYQNLFAANTGSVFIVVIDGARYSETFGDVNHQYIPKIWNQLRPLGTIYTTFYIDGWTRTNPGHASIITGTWQYLANDGTERPDKPTLFEYYRKQYGTSLSEDYVVLGKDKLQILAYSNHPDYGYDYRASVKLANQVTDLEAWRNLQEVMTTDHPHLVIVNFPETDVAAHTGVWESYVNALSQADSLTYELWNLIQSDSIYSNKTTMFVTNDHGRHLDNVDSGFKSHGDSCEGCRHIMLLALGPHIQAGIVDNVERKQIDIAPTVGTILHFATPLTAGNVIDTALPVELVAFEAHVQNAQVLLVWKTVSETNNYGFQIERSIDSDWESIGFVHGSGTTTEAKSYAFVDRLADIKRKPSILKYRLKQIDTDGSFEFSQVLTVEFNLPQSDQLSQNYPNPFNPSTTIHYSIRKTAFVQLQIINPLGQLVRTLVNQENSAGVYAVVWDGKNENSEIVASGTYFYTLKVGINTLISKRMLMVK